MSLQCMPWSRMFSGMANSADLEEFQYFGFLWFDDSFQVIWLAFIFTGLFQRETNFLTSCLLACTKKSSKVRYTSKFKNLL